MKWVCQVVDVRNRKRPSVDTNSPSIASLRLWVPLLFHLAENTSLSSVLADHILTILIRPSVDHADGPGFDTLGADAHREEEKDPTFRWALAVWLIWLWRGTEDHLTLREEVKKTLWRRLLGSLLTGDVMWVC